MSPTETPGAQAALLTTFHLRNFSWGALTESIQRQYIISSAVGASQKRAGLQCPLHCLLTYFICNIKSNCEEVERVPLLSLFSLGVWHPKSWHGETYSTDIPYQSFSNCWAAKSLLHVPAGSSQWWAITPLVTNRFATILPKIWTIPSK